MGTQNLFNILKYVLWPVRVIADLVTGIYFDWFYRNKHKSLMPIKTPILLESASSLANKIRNGQLKSSEVIKAYVGRIKDVNDILNAIVESRFEEAIEEARLVDELIASGRKTEEEMEKQTPFLGVPFTIKECFSVKGFHHSAGLLDLKDNIAEENCPPVAALKNAGAILLGTTNVSEFCMWHESHNRVYGRTANPYNTTRGPGGSSGGEGSIIAAAGSLLGCGSDIGGSVRIPCFYNGIFGHKPTAGIVSIEGQLPPCEGDLRSILTTGPMCRYATDLIPTLKILAQENAIKLRLDEPVDLKQLRMYYMEDDGGFPLISDVDSEIKASIREAATYFERTHGIRVEKANISELYHSLFIWEYQMRKLAPRSFSEVLSNGKGQVNAFVELFKWAFGCSNHTLPALVVCLSEKIVMNDPEYVKTVEREFASLGKCLRNLLGENGVLLYPTCARPAPYHNQPLLQPFNFIYAAIFNLMGLPSTHCPTGLGSNGIPLGFQVIGNLYQDRNTLAVAVELEKAFGGWVPQGIGINAN